MATIATLPFKPNVTGTYDSTPFAVPGTRAETAVSLLTNITPADLLNPLLSLEAALEVSFDNGVTWERELGFTWRGGPRSPLIPPTLSPWARLIRSTSDGARLPVRFRGAMVRLRFVVPTPMAIGGSVEIV